MTAMTTTARHPRDRLALDIAGLGSVLNVQAAIASSEGFSQAERSEAFRRVFLAGAQVSQLLSELERYAPVAAEAGYGAAKHARELVA